MNGCLCGICCKGSVDWISGSHFCEFSPPAGAPLRPADRRVDALSARALETAIACSCRRNYKHENNHPDDICGGFSQQFSFPSERSNRRRKLREQAGLGCVMFVCFGSSAACIIKQSLLCVYNCIYIYIDEHYIVADFSSRSLLHLQQLWGALPRVHHRVLLHLLLSLTQQKRRQLRESTRKLSPIPLKGVLLD